MHVVVTNETKRLAKPSYPEAGDDENAVENVGRVLVSLVA